MLESIAYAAHKAALELCVMAKLSAGQTVIIGCSTSEIAGHRVGTSPSAEIGAAVFDALHSVFIERGIFLAAQCCEHLNRAIIVEREASAGFEIVNAVPSPDAGGAFASAAYKAFRDSVALAEIKVHAGLDIGGTLIGMHLKRVAVPIRLETTHIGKASLTAARTRPPLIGGVRAKYDETLL